MGSMPLVYALTSLCTIVAGQDTVDMRGTTEALRWPLGVPRLDTEPNRALQAVLDELRRQRGAYMFLRVARRYASCPHTYMQNMKSHLKVRQHNVLLFLNFWA